MKNPGIRLLRAVGLFSLILAILSFLLSRPICVAESKEDEIYLATQANIISMMDKSENAVYGNEWFILDLARDDKDISPAYLQSVIDTITQKNGVLHTGNVDYTNYAKLVLTLSSLGIDATDVEGYNLVQMVSSFPLVEQQGINGVIYALLALDCQNYELDPPADISVSITRDTYINAILDSQLPDGGWDWADKAADPDMTAMAVQALAPYYEKNEEVKLSIDTALQTLSNMQQPDGGFTTEDASFAESSESVAMVIMALTSLGINPTEDTRFIKNGYTTIDNLCTFAADGGGFKHTIDGT